MRIVDGRDALLGKADLRLDHLEAQAARAFGTSDCSDTQSCFGVEYCVMGLSRVSLQQLVRMSSRTLIAVDAANKFVGCIAYNDHYPLEFTSLGEGPYIHTLCVAPQYRRSGMGMRLLRGISDEHTCCCLSVLMVEPRMQGLCEFYARKHILPVASNLKGTSLFLKRCAHDGTDAKVARVGFAK